MQEILILTIVVVAAGFLQGLTGFGFVLIALPLLGFFIEIKTIIPLLILLALCISITLSIQLRNSINFKNIYRLMAATLPGIPLGVYALTHIPTPTLSIGLGVIMICFAGYQLYAKPKPIIMGILPTLFAGFSSGILAGSIGAGGPPIIIYSALEPWDKDQAKATLAFYFAISGACVSLTHASTGLITTEVVRMFLISLPALVFGLYMGTIAYTRLSDQGYKKLTFILVFILGCTMLYKNI